MFPKLFYQLILPKLYLEIIANGGCFEHATSIDFIGI